MQARLVTPVRKARLDFVKEILAGFPEAVNAKSSSGEDFSRKREDFLNGPKSSCVREVALETNACRSLF